MTFTNLPVDIDALPRAAELELRPPDPAYRRLLRLEWRLTTGFCFLVAGVLFYFIEDWHAATAIAWTGGALALLFGWWYLLIEAGWRWRGWAVREHDVVYQRGWIFRRLHISPFSRIQNCSLSRGPLERRYGLASLVLYTAGADAADLRLRGLRKEEAERIREYLLNRIHGNADAPHPEAVAG